MTLQEFNDKAVEIAVKYGYKGNRVTVISGIYEGMINHKVQVFSTNGIVQSLMLNNPLDALQSFEDNVIHNQIKYDRQEEDLEIS
jgi:hypothetical protein